MRFRTAAVPTIRATSALEQLHAELAGKLQTNKRESRRLTQAMRHVEAVLKLLQPGYNVATIAVRRRKSNPWFKRGTVLRHIIDVLRTAETPLTPREITDRMIAARRIVNPDPDEVYKLSKSGRQREGLGSFGKEEMLGHKSPIKYASYHIR